MGMRLKQILLTNLASSLTYASATQSASSICALKYFIYGLLPTIALICFLSTPFVIGSAFVILIVGYLLHEQKNPNVKIDLRDFKSFHLVLKLGVVSLIASVFVPIIGVVIILFVVIAPALLSIFISGTALNAWQYCS